MKLDSFENLIVKRLHPSLHQSFSQIEYSEINF